jgi:trk system potassium uptake protein TrkA
LAKNSIFTGVSGSRIARADSVAVIGLGRFGQELSIELMNTGTEVLGIDAREEVVQRLNGQLTRVVVADSTREEVLRELSVDQFERVVVAIGSDLQASILTASMLVSLGIPSIWAKALNDAHGRILSQLGVHHVVYPEKEMGRRVAHLVRGAALDFLEIDNDYVIVKMTANSELVGRTLGESRVRSRFNVTILAIRHDDAMWLPADSLSELVDGDVILVGGSTRAAEEFAQIV